MSPSCKPHDTDVILSVLVVVDVTRMGHGNMDRDVLRAVRAGSIHAIHFSAFVVFAESDSFSRKGLYIIIYP